MSDEGTRLASELVERVAKIRREGAEVLRLLSQVDQGGFLGELGYGSVGDLYADVARVSRAEGKKQAARAEALHGRVVLAGNVAEPALPATAAVFADGEIGERHVDTIRRLHDSLSDSVPPDAWLIAEEALAEVARGTTPDGMRRAVNEARAHVDPDGEAPDERELANPQRELHTSWRGDTLWVKGFLDREAGMLLEAALSPLAKPRPEQDGERDGRSSSERHGDALAELARVAARSGELGDEGGEPVTIMVTIAERDLRDGIGHATTLDGASIPVSQLRRMACDATVIPTVLGTHGEIVDLGRTKRLATPGLRHRLALRDRGCAHPHCTAPPSRTQAHHIIAWADGGRTDLDNLVLLCPYHHRQIHHGGWTIRMRHGVPEFHPPGYLRPFSTVSAA